MKTIINIAKTELKTLFYSPIAWLILIIFTIQANMAFYELFERYVKHVSLGNSVSNLTTTLFTHPHPMLKSLFTEVSRYLYLYIPLLTMGLLSKEISSGSIKLLFSSPISSRQIVFGKFLSMMIYGLFILAILGVSVLFADFTVKDLDIPYLLSGLLGIYLLLCAYAAIGLFMSSLTSYQVVAAISTLALLAVLNYVGTMGQDIDFVRDITYWLSISGRSTEMVVGLINSEDVLYFLIVIMMFLGFTIVKLQSGRVKGKTAIVSRYAIIIIVGLMLGYFSSRPSMKAYADTTATKWRSLTPNSQDIINKLDGGLTITTYVNLLGRFYNNGAVRNRNNDMNRYEQYARFKPEIKFKYVYYWDKPSNNNSIYERNPDMTDEQIADKLIETYELNPDDFLNPEEIKEVFDLSDESNRFVSVIERENGERAFLRIFDDERRWPAEAEISAALKKLVVKCPKVGFLTGHGERSILQTGERGFNKVANSKTFRYALVNQGFDVAIVDLSKNNIPEDINIMVISDMKTAMSEIEENRLNAFIAKGGNLVIAAEPKRREVMTPLVERFGVQFVDGIIIQQGESFAPSLIRSNLESGAPEKISYVFERIKENESNITMPQALGLDYSAASSKGFETIPLLQTNNEGSWNEMETTDFIDGEITLNTEIGERETVSNMGIALHRKIAGKEQKIIILGDADCFSNSEISMRRDGIGAANFTFFSGVFEWMSNGESPVDVRRPDYLDTGFNISPTALKFWKFFFLFLIPISITVAYLVIWLKRRKK